VSVEGQHLEDGSARSIFRDERPYCATNSSKGALVDETSRVLLSMRDGRAIKELRDDVISGSLLLQRSRSNRTRIWALIRQRYLFADADWLLDSLMTAASKGPQSDEFLSLLYLLYALRDRLTFDFVTEVVWERTFEATPFVSRNDVLDLLTRVAQDQTQVDRWSESTRIKLAGSILTALRDFGVLEGRQKKSITRPPLPDITAEVLLRILITEGNRGREVIEAPAWRLFLRSESEVATAMSQLAQSGRIRFEKVGATVVLDTPAEWEIAA
jgi:hypothetical protein